MYAFIVIFATVISVITPGLGSSPEESEPSRALSHISYKDGDSVELKCPLKADVNVTWSRYDVIIDGTELVEDTKVLKYVIFHNNNTLRVNKIHKEDAGNYTCTTGDRKDSLTLEAAARFLDRHVKSVSVTEGGHLLHRCRLAWAYPEDVEVTWYRGETLLENDNVKIFITDDTEGSEEFGVVPNGQLEIRNIQMSDRDDYTCKVDNGAAVKEHTVLVRVKSKLAPLWPFLGILLEVLILVVIIVLWERSQKKKREQGKDD